ncbi:DUF3592 domain-containing protein [Vibrio vulnificus]
MLKKYLRILLLLLFSSMFLLLVYVAVARPMKIGFGCYISQSWDVIPAKIIHAEVDSMTFEDTNRRRKIAYAPKVSYEYNYGGKVYVGNRYSWVKSYDNDELHDEAKRLVYTKDIGKEIKIFVNPAKPSESVWPRYRVLVNRLLAMPNTVTKSTPKTLNTLAIQILLKLSRCSRINS